jgi:hypothetical protein
MGLSLSNYCSAMTYVKKTWPCLLFEDGFPSYQPTSTEAEELYSKTYQSMATKSGRQYFLLMLQGGGIFSVSLKRSHHLSRNMSQIHFGNPIFLVGNYLKMSIMG